MRGRWLSGDEWWRPLPPEASSDALRVLAARGIRAFGDGYAALLLAGTLTGLRLYARLDEAGFRKVVLSLLLISGLGLVVRGG